MGACLLYTSAIYGSNEHSANAIITANENLNKCGVGEGKIVAAGFDSGAAQIQAVKDGVLLGSITQAPVAMGETLVQLLYDAASGNTAAVKDTDTGCQWYTAENCGDAEICLLYTSFFYHIFVDLKKIFNLSKKIFYYFIHILDI